MADVAQLFDEWAAAPARGEQPDALAFLGEAGAGADELAAMMDRYLRARPRAEPDPEWIEVARAWVRGEPPLAQLRARRGVRRDEVIDAVIEEFHLGADKRPIVKRYYHELESGLLDASRLSRPLVDLLTRVLKAPAASILAWRPRPLDATPAYRLLLEAPAAQAMSSIDSAAREPLEDDAQVRQLFISDH